jgi:hypothetical protein
VDVDNDGWADLVTANYYSDTVSVLGNLGNGTFAGQVTYTVGDGPRCVTSVDVDKDGWADLVAANSYSYTVSVLRNQGNGTFEAQVAYAVGGGPYSVTSADVDKDGRADLVTANYYSDTVSVLRNLAPVQAADAGDSSSSAVDVGVLTAGAGISWAGQLGNGFYGSKDVDMIAFTLATAGTVVLDIDAAEGGSSLDSYLRLFDASGVELIVSDDEAAPGEAASTDSFIVKSLAAGTYYVGVSGSPNLAYFPHTVASGVEGSTGDYELQITLAIGGDATLDGCVDAADFIAMKRNFGTGRGATWGQGDLDGDGDVDFGDLQTMTTNFGASPEPTPAEPMQADAPTEPVLLTAPVADAPDTDILAMAASALGNRLAAAGQVVPPMATRPANSLPLARMAVRAGSLSIATSSTSPLLRLGRACPVVADVLQLAGPWWPGDSARRETLDEPWATWLTVDVTGKPRKGRLDPAGLDVLG